MSGVWHHPADVGKEAKRVDESWTWDEGHYPESATVKENLGGVQRRWKEASFLCLPLRSGVLALGMIGSTLAISGLVAYAIIQVCQPI